MLQIVTTNINKSTMKTPSTIIQFVVVDTIVLSVRYHL